MTAQIDLSPRGGLRGDARSRLEFIKDLTRELEGMARSDRFDFVAYLLGMAYVEMCDVLRGQAPAQRKRCPIGKPIN
jgi:hypothetical protein